MQIRNAKMLAAALFAILVAASKNPAQGRLSNILKTFQPFATPSQISVKAYVYELLGDPLIRKAVNYGHLTAGF